MINLFLSRSLGQNTCDQTNLQKIMIGIRIWRIENLQSMTVKM